MILLGWNAGGRTVNVRVDDLTEQEADRVRVSFKLIMGIYERRGNSAALGMVTCCLGWLAAFTGAIIFSIFNLGSPDLFLVSLGCAVALAVVVGLVAHGRVKNRSAEDAQTLLTLMITSPQCEAFVRECASASEYLKDLLHNEKALSPAPTSTSA